MFLTIILNFKTSISCYLQIFWESFIFHSQNWKLMKSSAFSSHFLQSPAIIWWTSRTQKTFSSHNYFHSFILLYCTPLHQNLSIMKSLNILFAFFLLLAVSMAAKPKTAAECQGMLLAPRWVLLCLYDPQHGALDRRKSWDLVSIDVSAFHFWLHFSFIIRSYLFF